MSVVDEVFLCYNDAISRLEKVQALRGKVVGVFDREAFFSLLENKNSPYVGVFYETTQRAVPSTQLQGRVVNLFISTILYDGDICKDQKQQIDRKKVFGLLNDMRHAFKDKTNPGGRLWSFESETPFSISSRSYILYHQRWSTRLVLTE